MRTSTIYAVLIGIGSFVNGSTPTLISGISEYNHGTIWFARIPEFKQRVQHQNEYLLCKQAHSGYEQWVDRSSTDGECKKCFCLPDTQKIGCTHCDKQPKKRNHIKRLPSKLMEKRRESKTTAESGVYVNHEACIRANRGRTLSHGCNHCVCHQNGTLSCTKNACMPKLHIRQSNNTMVFDTFEMCVKAHGNKSTFKVDCNSCKCTSSGAVACTLKACPSSLDNNANATLSYANYDECIQSNGASSFKRECNKCHCLKNGQVACTRRYCPQTPTST
ncbi:hypothetical protein COEREDRAFT_87710 [Coemansia reversa NRRL 1564]|uniref:Pacifastin domain-containing protein n=1 Tax=Coemansia reversa (strain ATCC 12441 / NRRL 1564) TaxID=763665 RepID=A0A2G5B931_COERN|nr:hypothetical protein COEREDRAFT_87710 [Coemansia reversa NRRL 1564]|eukprot:PIA15518.1 hypothetical protein COEREDRAFT_87710 [Coemansia reversa NRRL 1564]